MARRRKRRGYGRCPHCGAHARATATFWLNRADEPQVLYGRGYTRCGATLARMADPLLRLAWRFGIGRPAHHFPWEPMRYASDGSCAPRQEATK